MVRKTLHETLCRFTRSSVWSPCSAICAYYPRAGRYSKFNSQKREKTMRPRQHAPSPSSDRFFCCPRQRSAPSGITPFCRITTGVNSPPTKKLRIQVPAAPEGNNPSSAYFIIKTDTKQVITSKQIPCYGSPVTLPLPSRGIIRATAFCHAFFIYAYTYGRTKDVRRIKRKNTPGGLAAYKIHHR